MSTKEALIHQGESRFFIQLSSGHYYVDNWNTLKETRFIDHAYDFNHLDSVRKTVQKLKQDLSEKEFENLRFIKVTRYPLFTSEQEIPAALLQNGIEIDRKYVVANAGDHFSSGGRNRSESIPIYAFYGNGGHGNFMYAGELFEKKEANRVAKRLMKEELEKHTRRVVWTAIETVIIKEEIQL